MFGIVIMCTYKSFIPFDRTAIIYQQNKWQLLLGGGSKSSGSIEYPYPLQNTVLYRVAESAFVLHFFASYSVSHPPRSSVLLHLPPRPGHPQIPPAPPPPHLIKLAGNLLVRNNRCHISQRLLAAAVWTQLYELYVER